jgi:hypothetical protein
VERRPLFCVCVCVGGDLQQHYILPCSFKGGDAAQIINEA